jgi:hypothetical protein
MVGTEADKAVVTREQEKREAGVKYCQAGGRLMADGGIPRPAKAMGKKKNLAATKTMEGRPSSSKKSGGAGSASTGSGGSDRVYPGDSKKGASTSGGASSAMDRLGGGSGGYDTSRSGDGKTGGSARKPPGAAIITPAATPAPAETKPIKSMGKSDNTIDYGGGSGRGFTQPK